MLVSKDQFINFVTKYAQCHQEVNQFHNAIRPYFESPVCNYLQSALHTLEDLLVVVAECEDEDGIFHWWVEEVNIDNRSIKVQNTITGDVTEYDVLSPEGLYSYLYDMYHHDD